MNRKFKLFAVIIACHLAGCAWLSPKKKIPTHTSIFVQSEKVVNLKRLQNGGKLLIVPFKAGVDVEANEELDRVALMMIKGLVEVLNNADTNLTVLDGTEAGDAELIIKGYVTDMKHPSKWKKWILRKRKIELGIQAKMIDQGTNETVLVFSNKREAIYQQQTYRDLAYIIGQDMGHFIASNIMGNSMGKGAEF